MRCPDCDSTHIRKNGKKQGKQNHIVADCHRQFIDSYDPLKGYSNHLKRECLEMYVNGMGFRAIERVKHVHHTTVFQGSNNWGNSFAMLPQKTATSRIGRR